MRVYAAAKSMLAGACPALALIAAFGWGCAGEPAGPAAFPEPIAEVVAANDALGDPYHGRFPLADALIGLPGEGPLLAIFRTEEGDVPCILEPDHAPLTVANFVGLARGRRPFLNDPGDWVRVPYHQGLRWHRAEPGEFVQSGQRGLRQNGGFFLQDEISAGDAFDRAGILAMANTGGEHSASVEFFVTTGPARHLDGHHTIFGRCDGEAVLRRIERRVLEGEPPTLERVDIVRGP